MSAVRNDLIRYNCLLYDDWISNSLDSYDSILARNAEDAANKFINRTYYPISNISTEVVVVVDPNLCHHLISVMV